jgi:hypothetical protein
MDDLENLFYMKTLTLIIAATALCGAAYGQPAGSLEWLAQRNLEREMAQQREQLEEIQAQQRQIQHELFDRQLEEMNRAQRQSYLRQYLEDCE